MTQAYTRAPQRRWWVVVALAMPLIVLGSLLGLTSSADTALERIPVALVNNDELVTTINDDGEEEIILASRPLITELVTGDDTGVDWVITSTESANELLARGEVYAIFEIPANFSESVATLSGNSPQQAEFTIRTNPTRSYLAGIVGDQIGDSIATALSVEFAELTTEGLFTVVVDLGDAFGEASDAATTISEGTAELSDGITTLSESMPELDEGTTDLAEGFATFDDGVKEYTDGVTALSDGLDALSAGTGGLSTLSSGVSAYTGGVSTLSSTLTSLNAYIAGLDPSVGRSTLQAIETNLAAAAASGATLSGQTKTALDALASGITELDKGADALDTGGQELADASNTLRGATSDLAEGISELADGVEELDSGAGELAEGMGEFATGLAEGAKEISDSGVTVPEGDALTALVSPVVFSAEDRSDAVGVQATLASIIIPLGLWLVLLVTIVMAPQLSKLALTGTHGAGSLVLRTLRPLAALAGIQALVALTLLHTLGGAEWQTLGASTLVVVAGVLSYLSVHFLLWVWRPHWVPALSIGLAVIQIPSVTSLVPVEIFPSPYRILEGLTPLSWFSDALLAAVAGGDASRISAGTLALLGLAAATLVLSIPAMKARQAVALREQLGLVSL